MIGHKKGLKTIEKYKKNQSLTHRYIIKNLNLSSLLITMKIDNITVVFS